MGQSKFSTGTALALAAVLLSSSTTVYAVAALPKHSVGKKQLKRSAVTNTKIAKNAVTGSKVKESTLATVPRASFATNAGNTARLENKGAADFVGATRMAFGIGNASSSGVTTVLSLPRVGVTVTTDGTVESPPSAPSPPNPVVVVNLPSTAPAFGWFINSTWEDQTFSTMGGAVTLGAQKPVTGTSSREFTAHIWRSDGSAAIYLHCAFDTDNFTSSNPLSCWAFST
jgi:hypothetical protein